MSVGDDINLASSCHHLPGEAVTGHQPALVDDTDPMARVALVPGWGPLDGARWPAGPSHRPGADAAPAGDLVRGDLAEPAGDWPQRFAQLLTEALAGTRPARQVQPWTTKRAASQFDRLLRGFGDGGAGSATGQPRVLRVRTTRPAKDVIEMSVIAGFGPRARALALRLERATGEHPDTHGDASGGWVCTDIEAA
jgi:Family of unknown function (DUF6459)